MTPEAVKDHHKAMTHLAFHANSSQAMVFISVWLTLVISKCFHVSQCAHTWVIENLAEANFVEIFARAKQILSVRPEFF